MTRKREHGRDIYDPSERQRLKELSPPQALLYHLFLDALQAIAETSLTDISKWLIFRNHFGAWCAMHVSIYTSWVRVAPQ